ncbi:hypothetical protein GBA52_020841 [Prunus armeniaca]|nr:hypothetical protein GBA52_020841 [Prunus armeniaca]
MGATASQSTYPAGTSKTMSVKETCLICFEDTPIARMFSIGTCITILLVLYETSCGSKFAKRDCGTMPS